LNPGLRGGGKISYSSKSTSFVAPVVAASRFSGSFDKLRDKFLG